MRTEVRWAFVLTATAALAFGAACITKSYPEKQRYVFELSRNPTHRPDVAAKKPGPEELGVLRVRRVRVSPLFERKRFVYRTGENTFEDDFYREFFAPPGVLLRSAILDWLETSRVFSSVLKDPKAREADWTLEAKVHEFYVDARNPDALQTVLEMDFTLFDARSPDLHVVFQKEYSTGSDLSGKSGEAIMAGWAQSLSKVLSKLETDLQASIPQ
jgi:cholesterol transport system auxiliary component